MSGFGDITALSNLLQETDNAERQDDDAAQQARQFCPAAVAAPQAQEGGQVKGGGKAQQPEKVKEEDNGDIWSSDEIPSEEGLKLSNANNGEGATSRKTPKHEIYYSQSVDSSDVYLGLSDKTPGSVDCNRCIVKVFFPSHKLSDIDLDVTKNTLTADSDTYSLKLFLPQPVDADGGKAKFDSATGVLTVTLPILEQEW